MLYKLVKTFENLEKTLFNPSNNVKNIFNNIVQFFIELYKLFNIVQFGKIYVQIVMKVVIFCCQYCTILSVILYVLYLGRYPASRIRRHRASPSPCRCALNLERLPVWGPWALGRPPSWAQARRPGRRQCRGGPGRQVPVHALLS